MYQKHAPQLATVIPQLENNNDSTPTLILNAPGMETLTINPPDLSEFTVTQIQ